MSELCAMCGLSFGSHADLVIHYRGKHRDDDETTSLATNPEAHRPGLVCTLCGRRFPSPEALAGHSMGPHPARRPDRRRVGRPAPS